jgi:stearoyl-CoA desaturase (delta-9 desaturase)
MFNSLRTDPYSLEGEKFDYPACVQFFFMHVACLLVIWTGVSVVAVVVCLVLYFIRMFAITAGFHRLFAHRTYRTGRIFQFLIAFIGTTAYQKGPLWWSAHHRHHHIYADTHQDIHSPLTHGLWRSHTGWFLCRDSQETKQAMIPNLLKFFDLRLLDRYYSIPPAILAVLTFLLGWALEHYAPGLKTSGWQMLVCGFFISTVVLYHGVFTVNSLAHLYGRRRFETEDNSRNNLFVALITLGEGWHNNHHYYPSSERQGFYWWELDVTHYALRVLSWVGIVSDLQNPPARVYQPLSQLATSSVPPPESPGW